MTTIAPPVQMRWYQVEALDAVFEWFQTKNGDTAIVLPTGAGKSLLLSVIIARARESADVRVAVLATQAELVKQNADAARLLIDPRDVGIYSAGLGVKDASRPVTIANIQSMSRVAYAFDPFDILILDEAHTVSDSESGQYRTFIAAQRKQNPRLAVIGLTATPFKLSSGRITEGANAIFAGICYEAPVLRLIDEGYLCRPVTPRAELVIDTSNVPMRGGEYVPKALSDALDVDALTEAAADDMVQRFADRHHWLIFAVSVSHARHIAEALNARGVTSATVHGELSRDERAYRLDAFSRGEVRAIVNCELLTTGWNEPRVDAIALMRPTASAGLYMQMIGRGMRVHPSKKDCLIADYARLVESFGPIDSLHIPSKNSKKGTGEAPAKVCPACEHYQAAGVRLCVNCGFEFPIPIAPPLSATASTAPILSSDATPEWYDVTSVQYLRNEPKPPKTIPTLRVEYYGGYKRIASEWVCIEHEGYARTKAEQWWAVRSPERAPSTVDQAVDESADLRTPTKIAVAPDPTNPKYDRITGYQWPSAANESGLPKACWSCGHWMDRCLKWDAVPPEDVQAVGCEDYTDEEPLPF